MQISIVTDEVSDDFETAIEIVTEWGIKNVEIRGIGTERIPRINPFWRQRIPEIVEKFGVQVVAISPGIFKIPFYPDPIPESKKILCWENYSEYIKRQSRMELVQEHIVNLLPESIQFANELGAKIVIIFSFNREEQAKSIPDEVLRIFDRAAKMAEKAGITLALENEHICWGDTAENTSRIIRTIGSQALGINWDPANAYVAGSDRPYSEGYEFIRDFIVHVHVKNAGIDENGERGFMMDGQIDWQGQIKALIDDGYEGYITIETHCKPKIKCAKNTLDMIRNSMERSNERRTS